MSLMVVPWSFDHLRSLETSQNIGRKQIFEWKLLFPTPSSFAWSWLSAFDTLNPNRRLSQLQVTEN